MIGMVKRNKYVEYVLYKNLISVIKKKVRAAECNVIVRVELELWKSTLY